MFTSEELSEARAAGRIRARYAAARGPAQQKHWSWLFDALWAGSRRSKLRLHMPHTVLWADGVPRKWLASDENGHLARREFSGTQGRHAEFFAEERLAAVRDAFLSARPDAGEDEVLCVAEYADGEREELSLAQLDHLGAHREWRAQVRVLQQRVAARALAAGAYDCSAAPSAAPRAEALADAAVALCHGDAPAAHGAAELAELARALARFAEATYAPARDRVDEATDAMANEESFDAAADLGVEVNRLSLEFAIDGDGTLWLVRATDCVVTFVNSAPARNDAEASLRSQERQESAAKLAAELRRLLRIAAKRGVSAEASFGHFDAAGSGRADEAALAAGFARLGMRVPEGVAPLVLRRLAAKWDDQEDNFFTAQDLAAFSKAEDLVAFAKRSDDDPARSKRNADDGSQVSTLASSKASKTSSKHPSGGASPAAAAPYDDFNGPEMRLEREAALRRAATPAARLERARTTAQRPGSSPIGTSAERVRTAARLEAGASSGGASTSGFSTGSRSQSAALRGGRGKPMLALSQAERVTWDADPLAAVPGARAKTRRAMRELQAASKRHGQRGDARAASPRSAASPAADASRPATSQSSRADEEEVFEDFEAAVDDAGQTRLAAPFDALAPQLPGEDFFHVEPGLVMSYRVLRGVSRPSADHASSATILSQAAAAALSDAKLQQAASNDGESRFLLVAVPDFLQTLETLAAVAEPLLLHLGGRGDALLVGIPGMPHTCWPASTMLNNATLAMCIDRLLAHLSDDLGLDDANARRPVVFVGFGNGGNAVARYLTAARARNAQASTGLFSLRGAACVLVNAFFATEGDVRREVVTLAKLLTRATYEQRAQGVQDVHFSNDFLTRRGHAGALEDFWKTRAQLALSDERPEQLQGIVALLKGALRHEDVRQALQQLDAPVVLVTSKDDAFVPSALADLRAALGPWKFAESIGVAVTTPGAAFHEALDGGHEAAQERGSDVARVLIRVLVGLDSTLAAEERRNFRTVDLIQPARPPELGAVAELFDTLGSFERDYNKAPAPVDSDSDYEDGAAETKRETAGSAEGSDDASSSDDATDDGLSAVSGRARKSSTAPADTAEARKKREAAAKKSRKQQMAKQVKGLRAEAALLELAEREQAERFEMRDEDYKSRHAAVAWVEEELFDETAEQADARVSYLREARDEEEALAITATMTRVQTESLEAQRQAELRNEAFAVEEMLTFEGGDGAEGGLLAHFATDRGALAFGKALDAASKGGAAPGGRASHRLSKAELDGAARGAKFATRDVFESRRRCVLALQQVASLEAAVKKFHAVVERAYYDAKKLQRTVRLLETNASMKGSLAPKQREIDDLREALVAKEEEHATLADIEANRNRKLRVALGVAHKLKHAVAAAEARADDFARAAARLAKLLRERRGLFRLAHAEAVRDAEALAGAVEATRKRLRDVDVELARLRHHAGEGAFVNSEMWNAGVMQRVRKTELKASLAAEHKALRKELKQVARDVAALQVVARQARRELNVVGGEASVAEALEKAVCDALAKARAMTIAEELAAVELEQAAAAEFSAQREAAAALSKRASGAAGGDTTASRLRHKRPSERSVDEKRWVALDVLVNPVAYAHVTEAEAEEMKYDADYEPRLRLEDLERIAALPRQLQLALPFLFDANEVDAHRLLCRYTHEEGAAVFERLDASGGVYTSGSTSGSKSPGDGRRTSAKQQAETEALLDVVLRERKLARLRGAPDDALTEGEARYLAMDKVLHPFLYAVDPVDLTVSEAEQAAVKGKPGDAYSRVRDAYEGGASDVSLGLCDAWRPKRPEGGDHTRSSLLKLRNVEAGSAAAEADDECFSLLKQFYVNSSTTESGKRERAAVEDLGQKLTKALQGRDVSADLAPSQAPRIWGGFESVHPASVGSGAQVRALDVTENVDASTQHPAMFRSTTRPGTAPATSPLLASLQGADKAAEKKTKRPDDDGGDDDDGDGSSEDDEPAPEVLVCADLEAFNALEPAAEGPDAALFQMESGTSGLYDEANLHLETRASRTHRFEVGESEETRLLSLTVTVVYQGVFTARGYRLGRLAVALFRLPGAGEAAPVSVGHAPYALQQLNSGTALGRTVIVHSPEAKPLRPGAYQVVVGAASATKYSLRVEAHCARCATSHVAAETKRAVEKQALLRDAKAVQANVWNSMRLGERKLLVVGALLDEAEVESARCEAETERCNTEVALDDERMELRDEQRKQLFAEIRTLEVEYAHWCRLFASRSEERRDVLAGLRVLRAERRDSLFDIAEWTKDVKWLQRHLPQATGRIIGLEAATATAMALNTTFEHIGGGTAAGQWNKLAALKGHMSAMMTPAEDVRRRHQHEGHQALTLPERQWAVLDRTVFPDKYDWLSESDAADDARRAARGAAPKAALKRLPRACRGFAGFTPGELRRIDGMNFERLERNERPAWRLLHAYHDDPAKMHAGADEKTSPNNLANAVRCKHPKSRSREEREWVSLDRVLNPTLWRGLKIRDEANASPYANVERERERSEYLTPVDGLPPGALQAKDGTELMPDASPEKTRAGVGPALGNVVEAAVARASSLGSRLSGGNALDWDCPLDRAKLVEVWACSAPKVAFDADQRRSFDLLKKYNGPYALFVSFQREGAERAKARIRHVGNRLAGRVDLRDSTVETDLDARCRLLQEHMDVAVHNSNPTMASDVLHGGVPQRYPTHVLRLEIERELDCLLREQVYERERSQRFLLEMDDDEDRAGSSGDEAQDRQRNDQQLGKGVFAARKAVLLEKGKDAAAKASEAELAALGPRACFACRARQCEWKNSCDEAAITLRRNELSDEIVFTKLNPTMMFVESYVPLSASRGGNPQFRRADLIHELCWEDKELDLRLRLNALDRELHDAYATRKEYVEVKALHRYSTMMWTSNARRALERERNKYVASVVASDVVDECLEAMLEGWYFGERTSAFQVAGYVPSLKPEGFVKAGQDQVMAQAAAEDREAKRFKDGPSSEDLDSKRSGSPRSKAARIEAEAQFRLGEEKVLKAGSERAEHMDFTERTLKFGLFMITMQFFRSMAMIHREKASWNDEADGDAKTAPTDERRALRREQARAAERQAKLGVAMTRAKVGEARARARLDAERGAAAHKLRTKVRREQLDLASCALLQRLYRGHVGRKAARRWAIKRAELEAINALMTASAITMQRCFRGYQGRISASVARMEMAEFISMIRLEEAALDEEEYWRTHSYARFKKNAKMFLSSLSSGSGTKGLGDEDLAMIQRLQTTMEETND